MIIWRLIRRLLAVACIAGSTLTVHGKLAVQDPGSDHGNQLAVLDKNGAPMFWVNMFGAQSGAEPVCAMGFDLRPVICLGGPFGGYGVKPEIVYYSAGQVVRVDRP